MSSWVKRGGRIGRRLRSEHTTQERVVPTATAVIGSRCPTRQKDAPPEWAGDREKPLCCSTPVPPQSGPSFKEFLMKRIIIALVLALGLASAVGCGGTP